MSSPIEVEIEAIIGERLAALGRSDLFRKPLVAFSDASDKRYYELKNIIGDWHKNPNELLPDVRGIISYFVPFTKDVALQPKNVKYGSELWSEAYQEINKHFDVINEAIVSYLNGIGHSALGIKSTHTYDPKILKCTWSHRSAAVIAGLGTFAANGLLLTEKGSAGRFCSVITSATLKSFKEPIKDRCLYKKNGSCGLCLSVCPVGALTPEGYDKFACVEELFRYERKLKMTTNLESADTCGKCISICPFAYIE